MKSAPHLLMEDRGEFEQLLDEALRAHRRLLAAGGSSLTAQQVRAMALRATEVITATAADEYHRYVQARSELRTPAHATHPPGVGGSDGAKLGDFTQGGSEPGEPAGAGITAVFAVLAPLLAGAAAVIFLVVGYALELVGPVPSFAHTLRTTGWVFAAITAAAILAAAIGLLLTALRNGSTSLRAGDDGSHDRGRHPGEFRARGSRAPGHREHGELDGYEGLDQRDRPDGPDGSDTFNGPDGLDGLDEEVRLAREAWRHALLERGIRPFLREALQERQAPGPNGSQHSAPASAAPEPEPTSRMPHLGYHRPGFTSPEIGPTAAPRPSYSSPDFTSPGFGGPEQHPE